MLTKLTKAVIEKHGTLIMIMDKTGRIGISRMIDPDNKMFWAFGLGSVLIKVLAEEKI